MALSFLIFSLSSCSSSEDDTVQTTLNYDETINALIGFDTAFNEKFGKISETRTGYLNAQTEEDENKAMIEAGHDICEELIAPSETLLKNLQITEQDLVQAMEEVNEDDSLIEKVNMKELKCIVSLAIYDAYKSNESKITRVDYLDIVSCIGLGATVKQIIMLPGKKIVVFAVKKLAGRIIPFIGWGWAVASSAYCIAKL